MKKKISIFIFSIFILFLGVFVNTSYAVFIPLTNLCISPCIPGFITLFNYTFVLGIFFEIIFLLLRLLNKGTKDNNITKKFKNRTRLLIVTIIIISLAIIISKNQLMELKSEFIYLF